MSNDPMILRHSCGAFKKLRGIDRIIHVTRYWPHQVDDAIDLYELITLRLLRHALLEDRISSLESHGISLNVLVASILQGWPRRERRFQVHEVNATFGAILESLKFIAAAGDEPPRALYHASPPSRFHGSFIHLLHQEIEHYPGTVRLGRRQICSTPSEQIETARQRLATGSIVVLQTFKRGADLVDPFLQCLAEGPPSSGGVILIFRATREEPRQVTSIRRESFQLPNLFSLLDLLAGHGWSLRYRYAPDFDRDFLLPFDGESGVCFLLAAATEEDLPSPDGFQVYRPREEAKESSIEIFQKRVLDSYDSMFAFELPQVYSDEGDEFEDWLEERAWDASETDWSTKVPMETELIAEYLTEARENTVEDARRILLDLSRLHEQKRLSVDGHVLLAAHLLAWGVEELVVSIMEDAVRLSPPTENSLFGLLDKCRDLQLSGDLFFPVIKALIQLPGVSRTGLMNGWRRAVQELSSQQQISLFPLVVVRLPDADEKIEAAITCEDPEAQIITLSYLRELPDFEPGSPPRPQVIVPLTVALARLGLIEELRESADEMTRLVPGSHLAWVLRAFSRHRSGDDGFPDDLRQASTLAPDHPYGALILDLILQERGFEASPDMTPQEMMEVLLADRD